MSGSSNEFRKNLLRFAFVTSTAIGSVIAGPAFAQTDTLDNTNDEIVEQIDANSEATTPTHNIVVQVDPEEADFANNLYLAYVNSPQHNVNMEAKAGLEILSQYTNDKTTVAPKGVTGINIENDDILFFPFIYWPITDNSEALSEEAQKKVQSYIDGGGVIVFDIQSASAQRSMALKRVLGDINLRALERVDEEHTLARTFYLVSDIEGENGTPAIWAEQQDMDNPESMSSVVISQRRWAAQWSANDVIAGTKEHEQSLRIGVNLIMYGLTGNYKQDPDHNSSVLEKLELLKKNP